MFIELPSGQFLGMHISRPLVCSSEVKNERSSGFTSLNERNRTIFEFIASKILRARQTISCPTTVGAPQRNAMRSFSVTVSTTEIVVELWTLHRAVGVQQRVSVADTSRLAQGQQGRHTRPTPAHNASTHESCIHPPVDRRWAAVLLDSLASRNFGVFLRVSISIESP